jgi:hypothetical protein
MRQHDPSRYVGDVEKIIREGTRFLDNETGAYVYWRQGKEVLLNENGDLITQMRDVYCLGLSQT